MNNSKLAVESLEMKGIGVESDIDRSPWLRQKESELVRVIEALQNITASSYWKILENHIFSGIVGSLQNKLSQEKDQTEIYRLQGQLVWARKYSNLSELVAVYQKELSNVREQLKKQPNE